jgi:hypothetical protein
MSASDRPRETWLVVASTGAAPVNLVCAAAIGLNEIDKLLFLVGVEQGSRSNNGPDEARRGKERLLRALGFGLNPPKFSAGNKNVADILSDMDDPSPWITAVPEFFGATGQGCNATRVIYVYTGGTKDMALGTWDGLKSLRHQRPDITIEFVSKQPRSIRWPELPQRSKSLVGGQSHVSLDAYLFAHGYSISNATEIEARRRSAQKRCEPLRALAAAMLGRPDAVQQDWMKLLNRLSNCSIADVAKVASSNELNDINLRDFNSALASILPGVATGTSISLSNGRWQFQRGLAKQQTFQGDWFEDWLYLEASQLLAATGAQVLSDLKIQRLDATTQGVDYQVDLAIFANDQLYVAEAKTFLKDNTDAQTAINKLVALRKAVVGPAHIGKAWLLVGKAVAEDAARREMAANRDIVFFETHGGIKSMMESLPALIGTTTSH